MFEEYANTVHSSSSSSLGNETEINLASLSSDINLDSSSESDENVPIDSPLPGFNGVEMVHPSKQPRGSNFLKSTASIFNSSSTEVKFRKFSSSLLKVLQSFESIQEWADISSFLLKFTKLIISFPSPATSKFPPIPNQVLISKRLAQCLSPALPSGVHHKALEAYYVLFEKIDLWSEFYIYSYGILPFFKYASLTAKPLFISLFKTHFLALVDKMPSVLASLVQSLLPGLEEEGNDFFDQVIDLLLTLKSKSNESDFRAAIWDSILDIPSQRLSIFHFIHHQSSSNGNKFPLSPHNKAIISLGEAMLDSNSLVVRHALEYILKFVPFDNSLLSDANKKFLVRHMLMVLLHRDISLSRRVYSWISPTSTIGISTAINTSLLSTVPSSPPSPPSQSSLASISMIITVLQEMIFEILKSTAEDEGQLKLTRTLFKILTSLLDKEELNEPICTNLLMPVIEILYFNPLLIEDSFVFFETIDIQLIWVTIKDAIMNTSLTCDSLGKNLRLADFALSSIKMICDEECTYVILPEIFDMLVNTYLGNSIISSPNFTLVLKLLNTISSKIPIKCLGRIQNNEKKSEEHVYSTATLNSPQKKQLDHEDKIFGLKLLASLNCFQMLLRNSDIHTQKNDTSFNIKSSLNASLYLQVEDDLVYKLITWVFFGLLDQYENLYTSTSAGGEDINDESGVSNFKLQLKTFLNHLIGSYLDFKIRSPSPFILLTSLKILIIAKDKLGLDSETSVKISSQLPLLWEFFLKNPTLLEDYECIYDSHELQSTCPVNNYTKNGHFEGFSCRAHLPTHQCILTREHCRAALFIFSIISSASRDPDYEALLPTINGVAITDLDLFLSQYLNEPEAINTKERTENIYTFLQFDICSIPFVRLPDSEQALPWTLFSILEKPHCADWLVMQLSDSRSMYKFKYFRFLINYLLSISTLCPKTDYSIPMTISILKVIEQLLERSSLSRFSFLQSIMIFNVNDDNLYCDCKAALTLDLSCKDKCVDCDNRLFAQLLKAFWNLSTSKALPTTATAIYTNDNNSSNLLGDNIDILLVNLRSYALSVGSLLVHYASSILCGFKKCACLIYLIGNWVEELVDLSFIENNNHDNSSIMRPSFSSEEILARLSCVLSLGLAIQELKPKSLLLNSFSHPLGKLLIEWCKTGKSESFLLNLLEICFSFWGSNPAVRWGFFTHLLTELNLLNSSGSHLLFWKIVDFLTGDHNIIGHTNFLNINTGLDVELERGALDQDIAFLALVRSTLSTQIKAFSFEGDPFFSLLPRNGIGVRALSSLVLPCPFWVLMIALTAIGETIDSHSNIFKQVFKESVLHMANSPMHDDIFLVEKFAPLAYSLIWGLSDLYRDLFLHSPKNSLLSPILISQNPKSHVPLPQLTEQGLLSLIFSAINFFNHPHLTGYFGQLVSSPISDSCISSFREKLFLMLWTNSGNTHSLHPLLKDTINSLSRKKPSFLIIGVAVLDILSLMYVSMQPFPQLTKVRKESIELISRLLESLFSYLSKSSNAVTSTVTIKAILSPLLIEGTLFAFDEGSLSLFDVPSREHLLSSLISTFLLPCIKAILFTSGLVHSICTNGCRCVGYFRCTGFAHPFFTNAAIWDSLSNWNALFSGNIISQSSQVTLHVLLSTILVIMQNLSFTTSLQWRKELLELLFLDANVKFFTLPLFHENPKGGGTKCWCIRKAFVSMMTASVIGTSAPGSSTTTATFDSSVVDVISGTRRSFSSTFFSLFLGKLDLLSGGANSTLIATGSSGSGYAESAYLNSTVIALRRLAYAVLVSESFSPVFLTQVHEKVSELFRQLRAIDHYSNNLLAASSLLDALFLLFRILIIRFDVMTKKKGLVFGIDNSNGGGTPLGARQATERLFPSSFQSKALSSTPTYSVANASINGSTAIQGWWSTLNSELIFYVQKITSILKEGSYSAATTGEGSIPNDEIISASGMKPKGLETKTRKGGGETLISDKSLTRRRHFFRRKSSTSRISASGESKGQTSLIIIFSDLVSICKLLDLLLKSGVEEFRMQSWWLFGPSGLLSQLFALIFKNSDDTQPILAGSFSMGLDIDEEDEYQLSELLSFMKLAIKGWSNCEDDDDDDDNNDDDGEDISPSSLAFKSSKCDRVGAQDNVHTHAGKFCKIRTSSYHSAYIEDLELAVIEEELSLLDCCDV